MYYIYAAFLILSGIASLTYQVTWVRLLGQSLGSTHASISTVLAAFFLGLAAGSYFAERYTKGRLDSLKPYLVLEILIGLSGLALLPVLLNLDQLLSYAPAFGSELSLKFVLAVMVLVVPTTCMGATFPVMAAILVRKHSDMGRRISQLYSFNTFGAVFGACLSGFVLIPSFGLDGAIYIAVFLNLAIAFIGMLVDRQTKLPMHELAAAKSGTAEKDKSSYYQLAAAAILLATGFISIAVQVGWTKYLSIFTGSTIYGFSAILTIFLAGIAIGSHAIRNRLDLIRRPESVISVMLILLAGSLMLALAGLSLLPEFQLAINDIRASDTVKRSLRYVLIALVIFPPTFLFGAIFPLNLRLYCKDLAGVQKNIGKAYAMNTIASIFGATFAGYWAIPVLGTNMMLVVLGLATLALPLVWLPLIASQATRTAVVGLIAVSLYAFSFLPQISFADIVRSVEYTSNVEEKQELLFLKEGKAGVISLTTPDGESAALHNNGLQESFFSLTDPHASPVFEGLLGLVPYMIHPDPKKAFAVGFGGGVTTRALTRTQLNRIHVVELEPYVVEAVSIVKDGPITTLSDPRVQLTFNDARNTLLVEDEKYDLIVSQPSHPWLAGSANVFTQEFWQIANGQLTEKGVFSQWINLFRMDSETLKSLFKAFYSVFPHGFSLASIDSGDLLLIGSRAPINYDLDRINSVISEPGIKPIMDHIGINNAYDMLWYFALSRDEALEASKGSRPNTDTNLLSEVRLSAILSDPQDSDLNPYRFLRETANMDIAWMLGKQPAEKIYRLAEYVLRWDNDWMAGKVIDQLEPLDPTLARSVSHQRLVKNGDAINAGKLYLEHAKWAEINHLLQAGLYVENGQYTEAQTALNFVSSGPFKDELKARLLYETGDDVGMEAFKNSKGNTRMWYLLMLSKTDFDAAGKALSEMNIDEASPLPALQFLVGYHSLHGNKKQMNRYALLLASVLEKNNK